MSDQLIPRLIAHDAQEIVENFRVAILNGARQSGKTTLLQQLVARLGGTYVSLDEVALRQAARADPMSFVAQEPKPLVIDEVQRGGDDLVLAVKRTVDSSSARSQFVLAGSTRFLSTPSLTESLAGRAAIVDIWPFAERELARAQNSFVDFAFGEPESLRHLPPSESERAEYFTRICSGGYPEVVAMSSARARRNWYETYLRAVVEADVREMARIDEPSNLLLLLRWLAANTAQEVNAVKLSSDLQLHRRTISRYLGLLATVFLVHEIPAWSRNLVARAVHRPKLHLTDTGLAAYLLGVDPVGLAKPVAPARGPLVETFIVNELAKQVTWAKDRVRLHHWRISSGPEVDLVLERADGHIVGVEAKATDTIRESDFSGLATLRDRMGSDFLHGFAFYTGPRALAFGDRLTALPISALWTAGS